MANNFYKLFIHMVFAVKNRNATIAMEIAPRVHSYMTSILERHGHQPVAIGGMPDHVHILFIYNPKELLAEVAKSVKAGTSRFINENHLTGCRFEWQRGSCYFSVSQPQADKVIHYIENQQSHHKTKTFLQEYESFLNEQGIEFCWEYAFTEPL